MTRNVYKLEIERSKIPRMYSTLAHISSKSGRRQRGRGIQDVMKSLDSHIM
jgi:hypothetical protein